MKVLVTGAAGRLGGCVCRLLQKEGVAFRAVDKAADEKADYPVEVVDLLERDTCDRLLEGVEVLAHFANYAHWGMADPQVVYGENVTMNMNLFQGAADAGIKRIVFSSTIQVLDGELPVPHGEPQDIVLPYLPLDSDLPAYPRNSYSLSKVASENMLQYFSDTKGMTCVAIRYPWLLGTFFMEKAIEEGGFDRGRCNDGFAYLPVYSGAELAIKAMTADIEGYRCYFPAAKDNMEQRDAREIIKEQLSYLPCKKPLEEMDSLVDCSVIEKELGWEQPLTLAESLEKYRHLPDVRP